MTPGIDLARSIQIPAPQDTITRGRTLLTTGEHEGIHPPADGAFQGARLQSMRLARQGGMRSIRPIVEGKAAARQLRPQGQNQIAQGWRGELSSTPQHPGPREGAQPIQDQLEGETLHPPRSLLDTSALFQAGRSQKDQGEMDILGVSRAPSGLGGQLVLKPGEGQTLPSAGPQGQEEILSHPRRASR